MYAIQIFVNTIICFIYFRMPRTYHRQTNKGKVTLQQLREAIEAVNSGIPVRVAAARYGIPKSTFFYFPIENSRL
jgi:hypothetical protein